MSTPEGRIQLEVLKYLRARGIMCWRNHTQGSFDAKRGIYVTNPYIMRGAPDIIAILPPHGRFVGFEVKTPRGKQSPDQALFERRSTALGGAYFVVRSVRDTQSALELLGVV